MHYLPLHATAITYRLQPRTLEIEHFLGVADEVKKVAARGPVLHVHDPKDPYKIIKSISIVEQVDTTPAFPEVRGRSWLRVSSWSMAD